MNLDRCHNLIHLLRIQLQNTIQNTNFVIPQGLFPTPMELQKAFQLGFFVGVGGFGAEGFVEEFGYGVGNRAEDPHQGQDNRGTTGTN